MFQPQMPPGYNRDIVSVSESRGAEKVPALMFQKSILLDCVDFWPVSPLKPLHNLQQLNISFWDKKPCLQVPHWSIWCPFRPRNANNEISFETSLITPLSPLCFPLCCMWKLITTQLSIPTTPHEGWTKTGEMDRCSPTAQPELPTDLRFRFGWDLIRERTVSALTLSWAWIILSASSQLWNGLMALIMPFLGFCFTLSRCFISNKVKARFLVLYWINVHNHCLS